MLASAATVDVVADALKKNGQITFIVDPVRTYISEGHREYSSVVGYGVHKQLPVVTAPSRFQSAAPNPPIDDGPHAQHTRGKTPSAECR